MDDSASRLRHAREKAGYETAKEAAEAMGAAVATYIQHENGIRGYPSTRAERYARFFRTTPEWLLYGKQSGNFAPTVSMADIGPRLPIQEYAEVMAVKHPPPKC